MLRAIPALINPSRFPQNPSERSLNRIMALPHYTGGKRPIGQTRMTYRNVVPVEGTRKITLKVDESTGTVETVLGLGIQYADLLSDAELRPLKERMRLAQGSAKGMSLGPLTRRRLRQMGHPYGWGRRKGLGRLQGSRAGVSNRAIVNMPTGRPGKFAKSWYWFVRRSKDGLDTGIGTSAPHSQYLAKGTRKMKAHYPGPTVMAQQLQAIRSEQRRLVHKAQKKKELMWQMEMAQASRAAARHGVRSAG